MRCRRYFRLSNRRAGSSVKTILIYLFKYRNYNLIDVTCIVELSAASMLMNTNFIRNFPNLNIFVYFSLLQNYLITARHNADIICVLLTFILLKYLLEYPEPLSEH